MRQRLLWAILSLLFVHGSARAEVRELKIVSREAFAGGMAFGDVGPYEKIVGIARFAVDPSNARNRAIIDLSLAPKNADGKVEFEADVCILAPKDPAKGNRTIFYDVNNRGNKLALRFFNDGPGGNDPSKEADAGNGFLMRRGYTVVWCGWVGELTPGGNRMLLKAPIATENGKPIRGVVRYETYTDKAAEELLLSSGRDGHGVYPPTKKGEEEGVLTWRRHEGDERIVIPRGQWSLDRQEIPRAEKSVAGTLPPIKLKVQGGFRPGYLYELICEAEGPIVQGLGFAAVRDLLAFLRHDGSERNPIRLADGKPALQRAYGFGVSQSGRFLRHFVYQGFNADEKDRKVFDALMPHVAGGGLGFFNHRFAQPTRHNGQHENHLYPADVFPFTYGDSTDPFSKKTEGICKRLREDDPKLLPRIMHTQSAAEYWHRAGSLVHTTPLGTRDADIPEDVRIYAFGGTQHGPAKDPPERGMADNLPNPGNYRPLLRALLDAMDAWVRDGTAPPPSVYPMIERGTLVKWDQASTGFPSLPGVRYPEVIQRPPFLWLGPDFEAKGIISVEPPEVKAQYTVMVMKSGPDGNDLGTLLAPEVAVPLATYTGWNLRRRDAGAEAMLASLQGSYIPFAKTKDERKKAGDPRDSIEERYGSFGKYVKQFDANCLEMVKRRYLLAEDAERLVKEREKVRGLFPAEK